MATIQGFTQQVVLSIFTAMMAFSCFQLALPSTAFTGALDYSVLDWKTKGTGCWGKAWRLFSRYQISTQPARSYGIDSSVRA